MDFAEKQPSPNKRSAMLKQTAYCLLSLVILISFQCRKHKSNPPTELSKLPPETQTGAQTFGCLVNGKAFLPKGPSLNPILLSYYEYIYPNSPQGYVFQVAANDKSKGDNLFSIAVGGDSIKIATVPQIIDLRSSSRGNGTGMYYKSIFNGTISSVNRYITNDVVGGQLTITRFDSANQIVAGTFWFNAIAENRDTVKITNGRFDMHYTR